MMNVQRTPRCSSLEGIAAGEPLAQRNCHECMKASAASAAKR